MEVVNCDRGVGAPLVIVPGIQGRWEYMRPAVDALAEHFRVITFSLCGERVGHAVRPRLEGFDDFGDQVEAVLDRRADWSGDRLRRLVRRPDRAAVRRAASGADARSSCSCRRPDRAGIFKRRHDVYARCRGCSGRSFWPRRRGGCGTSCARRSRSRRDGVASRARSCGPSSRRRCRSRAWRRGRDSSRRWTPPPSAARSPRPTLVVTASRRSITCSATDGASAYATCIAGARAVGARRHGPPRARSPSRTLSRARSALRPDDVLRRQSSDDAATAAHSGSTHDAA